MKLPRPTYANVASTLALVLAMSMGGAYAHGKIGSAQIKQNAVKSRHIGFQQVKTADLGKAAVSTNRIKAKAVTRGKLAPGARPKTHVYTAGPHDFGDDCGLKVAVPVGASAALKSTWRASLKIGNNWAQVPGNWGAALYRVGYDEFNGRLLIAVNHMDLGGSSCGDAGHSVSAIRIFRTEADYNHSGVLAPVGRSGIAGRAH